MLQERSAVLRERSAMLHEHSAGQDKHSAREDERSVEEDERSANQDERSVALRERSGSVLRALRTPLHCSIVTLDVIILERYHLRVIRSFRDPETERLFLRQG